MDDGTEWDGYCDMETDGGRQILLSDRSELSTVLLQLSVDLVQIILKEMCLEVDGLSFHTHGIPPCF